ncbi:MAG: acetyl-CoA C-acetyltransferase [Azonexus sp.]|nr:acetyl-CoA C-acetyltransferase [Azonexus sp.]
MNSPIYVVDGARTPFLKAQKGPGPFSAADLATQAGRALLLRQPFLPSDLDEVILGCAAPSPDETNIGRLVALRLGCGEQVPGWTVMRNCASGMQAIDSAIANIQRGRAQLVLAGGVDALSRAPLLYSEAMVRWFAGMMALGASKGGLAAVNQKISHFLKLPVAELFKPVIGLMKGLTDPMVGLLMGQTAENLAWRFGIDRAQMDAYAVQSHQRALAARQAGYVDEIVPLVDRTGTVYAEDDGVRADATLAGMAKPRPFFDKPYGKITAANSSQITDGAAWVVLASEAAVAQWGLKPLGKIVDCQWAGLAPEMMGLGPVHATTPLLQRHGLALADIDYWELNEAFATQVLACQAAWQDDAYCRESLGLAGALGQIPEDRLNVDGGAVSIGHPVGASGARIVLHLLHVLRRQGARRGVASICIGGGLGGAMLVEACA